MGGKARKRLKGKNNREKIRSQKKTKKKNVKYVLLFFFFLFVK